MTLEKYKFLINLCNECASNCDDCIKNCLDVKDSQKLSTCIELCLYASELCRLAAKFMAMGDLYVDQICNLCAEICEQCGNECAKHPHDHSQRCAAVCKECAEACRTIVV